MKKIYKDHAERQEAYRERQKEKQETAAEAAAERAQSALLDLRFFSESGFEQNARWFHEEVHIHRQFLRALGQPDVQDGETLRQLSKRTWNGLLNADGIGISKWSDHLRDKYESGYDVWIPMFNPKTQQFDGWQGYAVHNAAKSGWFDSHWSPPKDCTGDECICIDDLPTLPPIKVRKLEPKQVNPERKLEPPGPPTEQTRVSPRYEIPPSEEQRLYVLGKRKEIQN